jgi:micrococcal nuclease
MFEYVATVVRVIDGDTVAVDLQLGFSVSLRQSCRLAGLNARELHAEGGGEARDHLAGLLGPVVTVRSVRLDKFAGRFDGVIVSGGVNVNERMIADGYAAAWDGSGVRPVPVWPIGA